MLESGEERALVVKSANGSPFRATMGCAREAFFYTLLAPKLAIANVPTCYYAHGDMETGETLLLIECLENAVPSGTFFGAASQSAVRV